MAVLIPSIGSCTFDSGGERRLAERLESKLENDYLCWYNVALGPAAMHPDFIVFHPRRGLLILEVKDWRASTIHAAVDVLQRDSLVLRHLSRSCFCVGSLMLPFGKLNLRRVGSHQC
jgi:hypothetical protein